MVKRNVFAKFQRAWTKAVNKLLGGDIKIFHTRLPRAVVAGVLAVILLYVGIAGIVSYVAPLGIKKDTMHHVDYVWRVYNGELPEFSDGVTYPPLSSGRKIHQAASHPPLFYVLHAPFMGSLLNEGKWKEAIAVGRGINIFFGVLCVLALAWAGWVFGGKKRELMAIAVPAIGATMYRFTTLNVVFGNDVLGVLFATLAFILMYKLLKDGVQTKHVVLLGLISILGMASKATYIVILAIGLLVVIIAVVMHQKVNQRRRLLNGALISFLITLAVAGAIGWFYYRNYQSSGSWFKASPDSFTGGRAFKSLKSIILGSRLWELFYLHSSPAPYISTAITSMGVVGYLSLKLKSIKIFYKQDKALVIMIVMLILGVIGILVTQIQLAVGYGSINFRYLLPALLPISLFLAYGLLQFRSSRAQLVSLAAISMGLVTLLPVATSSTVSKYVPEVLNAHGYIDKIFVAASGNNVPSVVIVLLLTCFVVGSLGLVASLFRLSSMKRN